MKFPVAKILFIALIIFCLFPFVKAPLALLLGIVFAQIIGNPLQEFTSRYTSLLLKVSVVGLGFGMDLLQALETGKTGILLTFGTIAITLAAGLMAGRFFRMNPKLTMLLSSGTAICGGSAIAAVAPSIKAEKDHITVSLGVVFILNSIALFLFPGIGDWFHLTQEQFGTWVAIAIHDTSSVVGAAEIYGVEALEIATTIKLTRTLYIMPLALIAGIIFRSGKRTVQLPYFIFFFVIAMALFTYMESGTEVFGYIFGAARRGLIITLFLIGSSLNYQSIKSVGVRPLIMGIVLWIFISIVSLVWVIN